MNGRLRAAGALILALAAFGCGSNDGSLAGYSPDGQPNGAVLIADVQPLAADSSTIVVNGLIFDASPAVNGFRLYVNPADQGFRPAADYLVRPTHVFSTGYTLYGIPSHVYDPAGYNDYQGRGARNSLENVNAPLTNHALLPPVASLVELARRLDVSLIAPNDSAFVDSTPTLSWAPTPGAASYLVRIIGANGIVYFARTNATAHQVEVSPGLIIEDMPMHGGSLYRWDVAAIDASNRIIGLTKDRRALLVQ